MENLFAGYIHARVDQYNPVIGLVLTAQFKRAEAQYRLDFEEEDAMACVLYYSWGELADSLLKRNLEKLGHQVVPLSSRIKNYDLDAEFSMEMMVLLHKYHCELCMSFNYFPIIASICNVVGIPYVSWVYDSPHLTLFSRTIFYSTNYIFHFDRSACEMLREQGVSHCFHLPLAVDGEAFRRKLRGGSGIERDVSFVGSFYTNQFNYFDQIKEWEEYARAECLALVEAQKFCYQEERIRSRISSDTVEKLVRVADLKLSDKYHERPLDMAVMTLQKKVTVEERRELLSAVSKQFETSIYTNSDVHKIPYVRSRGTVDYLTQMPKVFAGSRINLNITLRSIESGMPLRTLDIMACGGFLLSNYQPELAEYFEEGKELVLFYSKEDCLDKIAYYLDHEEERVQIAEAGCRKVGELFSYRRQLGKIFEVLG